MAAQPQPAEYYDVTIGAITDFGNDTREFELVFDPGKGMRFIPGQFAAVICPKEGKVIRRAYSIASPPEQKTHLELIIKLVQGGAVTPWFWSLKTGGRIRIHGPFGKFILPQPVEFDPVFISVGTGIAPFRSMAHHLLSRGFSRPIWMLFGTRYDNQIPYHAEFLDLARQYPSFRYIPTISRPGPGWAGETGYVQTKLAKYLPDPIGKRIYICGLNEMIAGVQAEALRLGFPKEHVHFERYD